MEAEYPMGPQQEGEFGYGFRSRRYGPYGQGYGSGSYGQQYGQQYGDGYQRSSTGRWIRRGGRIIVFGA
jgi:hypothetical protein